MNDKNIKKLMIAFKYFINRRLKKDIPDNILHFDDYLLESYEITAKTLASFRRKKISET